MTGLADNPMASYRGAARGADYSRLPLWMLSIGSGFVPGSGIADAGVGTWTPDGQTQSLSQNLSAEGWEPKLDAALQALSVGGDVAFAAGAGASATGVGAAAGVPLMAAGLAMKAPRATKGLINALRSKGLTGAALNKTAAAIAKINAGQTPTPTQMAALEAAARPTTKTVDGVTEETPGIRQAINAVVKNNPTMKGAPPNSVSADDFNRDVEMFKRYAEAGSDNSSWYPDSAAAIDESYAGNPEMQSRAKRATGIASQQTRVEKDIESAYRGLIHANALPGTEPLPRQYLNRTTGEMFSEPASPGHMYEDVNEKIMGTARGENPEPVGGKIGNFTAQLLTAGGEPTAAQLEQYPWMAQHINPETGMLFPTTDTVMHGMFGYGDSARAERSRPYVDRVIRAAGFKGSTSDPQAMGWGGRQKELGVDGKANYKTGLDKMTAQMNVETVLGSNTGLERELSTATMSPADRQSFDSLVRGAFTDDLGRSKILEMAGLPQMNPRGGSGYFEGQINPATVFHPVVPPAERGNTALSKAADDGKYWSKGDVIEYRPRIWTDLTVPGADVAMPLDDTAARALTMATLLHQKLGFQKAMGWIRPYPETSGQFPFEKSDYLQVILGRPLNAEETRAFAEAGLEPIARSKGAGFLVFPSDDAAAHGKMMAAQLERLRAASDRILGANDYEIAWSPTQRFYNDHDWAGGYDATKIDQAITALGPEYERRARDIQQAIAPEIGARYQDWASQRGITLSDDFKRTIDAWAREPSGSGPASGLWSPSPSRRVGLVGQLKPSERAGLIRGPREGPR